MSPPYKKNKVLKAEVLLTNVWVGFKILRICHALDHQHREGYLIKIKYFGIMVWIYPQVIFGERVPVFPPPGVE